MAWYNDLISGFTTGIGGSIAKVVGKFVDWIPGRDESIRNQINKLERERDDLENKPKGKDFAKRYEYVINKLHVLKERLENRS